MPLAILASNGHGPALILTLAGGLAAALVLGYITQRLKLSPIVGYLLAGIIVGPHTPGFTADLALAEQLAGVGIVLLMFGVGLSFHIKELLAVRQIAVPGALVQIAAATGLGILAGLALGWGVSTGLVFGLAISVASTVVLVRVLSDNNELHTRTGHTAVGWLVVEDLFTVVALVLIPALAAGASGEGGLSVPLQLLWVLVKISGLVLLTFVVGGRVVPFLLGKVAATRSRELFTLTVLVLALGIAALSTTVFGVSMELGAFLAGMVVGRSEFALRAATEAMPMRDAFAVLFFVSVGMLFNPGVLLSQPWVVLAALGIIFVGKPLAAIGIVLLLGHPLRMALAVGAVLAQIGEFSFLLATVARGFGLLPDYAYDAMVAAAIVTISVNPLIFRTVDPLERRIAAIPWLFRLLDARHSRRSAALAQQPDPDPDPDRENVVIVGYGPAGQLLARMLHENGVQPVVIDLNLETIQHLKETPVVGVYGDAGHADTLAAAGVKHAQALILSAGVLSGMQEIIRLAREQNPKLRILARANFLSERAALLAAGADTVYTGEGEVAIAMTEFVLGRLGATPEQIERERARSREELLG